MGGVLPHSLKEVSFPEGLILKEMCFEFPKTSFFRRIKVTNFIRVLLAFKVKLLLSLAQLKDSDFYANIKFRF